MTVLQSRLDFGRHQIHERFDYGASTCWVLPMQNQKKDAAILAAACVALAGFWAVVAVYAAPAIGSWYSSQQQSGDETPLQLIVTSVDNQQTANGNSMVVLTGRIANPTDRREPVPPLTAELRAQDGSLIHKWAIQPPVTQLDAKASVELRHTELDVPPNGDQLTVTIRSP